MFRCLVLAVGEKVCFSEIKFWIVSTIFSQLFCNDNYNNKQTCFRLYGIKFVVTVISEKVIA